MIAQTDVDDDVYYGGDYDTAGTKFLSGSNSIGWKVRLHKDPSCYMWIP